MTTGIIYMAVNTVNGKAYVGQTRTSLERRKAQHLSNVRCLCDTHFHRALRKHGEDTFTWCVLEDGIPEAKLSEREQHWIANTDAFHYGYNSTTGGEGGRRSPELKAKVSATLREKAHRGEHSSQRPEVRERISATHREKAARGENPAQRPEVRAKRAAVMKEQAARGELSVQRPSVRAKQSATHREKASRGENPMQNPEVAKRASATHKRNRRLALIEAGQQVLFECEE